MFYPEQSSGVGAIKVKGTRIKGVGGPVEGLQAVSRIRTIPASFHSVSSTPATFCCYFNRLPYLDSSRFLSDSQSNSSYVTRGGGRSFVQVHLSRSPLTADHRKPARALSHTRLKMPIGKIASTSGKGADYSAGSANIEHSTFARGRVGG